jgi:hypothetical protein
MTTLNTFLSLVDEFINELSETFPTEKKLKTYKLKFETMKSTNPRLILDKFMENVTPIATYITNKDESLILEEKSELIKELNLKTLWTSGITDNTKEAIWAHMNTLYVFGNTINVIPQNLLQTIESVAEQCAADFDSNGSNPADMLAGMQKLLASQMGNLK